MEMFNQVESSLENVDLSAYQEGGSQYFTAEDVRANPEAFINKICSLYRVVRPILSVVAHLPLPLPRVKNAIRVFMNLMDSICPNGDQ